MTRCEAVAVVHRHASVTAARLASEPAGPLSRLDQRPVARAEDMPTVSGTKLHLEIGRLEPGAIPGLVHAFRVQADGSAEELPVDHAFDATIGRGPGWYWLHLNL